MKVLIACEESQTVCKAFRARGAYGGTVGLDHFRDVTEMVQPPRNRG